MIRRSRLWASVVAVLLVSACAHTPAATTAPPPARVISPPDALLRCQSEPQAPPRGSSQAAVAEFVLSLGEAGRDCRGKLDAVRGYVRDAQAGRAGQ